MVNLYPLFTLRTDAIVGRKDVLDQIALARKELQSTPNCPTRLFYLMGEGGLGKTRILEEILKGQPHAAHERITKIIDLYDAKNHSSIQLLETIATDLGLVQEQPPQGSSSKAIDAFNVALRRFRDLTYTGSTNASQRQVLEEAFFAACQDLRRTDSLIILLDTAELLQFQSDDIRDEFGLDLPSATSLHWLTEIVRTGKLPRTLFIVAGRERKEISSQLKDLAEIEQCPYFWKLEGLSPSGAHDYFDELVRRLRREGHVEEASRIEEFPSELRTGFHQLTGGSPIALAMAVQLYLSGLGDGFAHLLEGAKPSEFESGKEKLRKALVTALAYQLFDDINDVVRLLPLVRKGLDAEILREVPKIQRTEEKCQTIIEELKQQIFIKTRPDGSVVLHDEIADWIDVKLYQSSKVTIPKYTKIHEIYRRRFRGIRDEIRRLGKLSSIFGERRENQNSPTSSGNSSPLPKSERTADKELYEALNLRRTLAVDLLHYALRADPVAGYKHYYELAEEAFNVGQPDYDALIHSEFLQWWNAAKAGPPDVHTQVTEQQGVTAQLVRSDLAVRWVQRAYNEQDYEKTEELTQRLQQKLSEELSTTAYHLLETYANTARGRKAELQDKEIKAIDGTFRETCEQLEKHYQDVKKKHPEDGAGVSLDFFLACNALGFAYYERGFFRRNVLAEYEGAIENYTRSIQLYRELSFEINQARSINDRAYAQAQVGDLDDAEFSVDDALELRTEFGLARLAAWSMNTKGIICTYGQRPVSAVSLCETAYSIFSDLEDKYGQMLALRALSEAHRRNADRKPITAEDQWDELHEALEVAERSKKIAAELAAPQVTRIEIDGEYGCALRDIASYCYQRPGQYPDEAEWKDVAERARAALSDVVETVQSTESKYLEYHLLDYRIDQAYLEYYVGHPGKACEFIEQAFVLCTDRDRRPDVYRDGPRRKVFQINLCKAHALLTRIYGKALFQIENHEYTDPLFGDREEAVKELARNATYTLFYTHELPDYRLARQANHAVYDILKPLQNRTLLKLGEAAKQFEEQERFLPSFREEHGLRTFIRNQFGVGQTSGETR